MKELLKIGVCCGVGACLLVAGACLLVSGRGTALALDSVNVPIDRDPPKIRVASRIVVNGSDFMVIRVRDREFLVVDKGKTALPICDEESINAGINHLERTVTRIQSEWDAVSPFRDQRKEEFGKE